MTDTTITEPISLSRLRHGDTFTFRGKDYVLVEHKQSKSAIGTIGDGQIRIYNLGMAAKVVKIGHSDTDYQLALAALYPPIPFKVGDKVRVVSNDRTRRQGVAGTESTVVRINSKTVGLANGWRISPSWVEAV